jgi:hypothetical protein
MQEKVENEKVNVDFIRTDARDLNFDKKFDLEYIKALGG